jgi:UDP-N-acetylmuramoylalanine--D-glutamate ligase
MDLKGKRALVIGLGKTGVETARFLVGRGTDVVLCDEKPESELRPFIDKLDDLKVDLRMGCHSTELLSGVDLIVPSPGVPPVNVLLKNAVKEGVEIVSEIELAGRFINRPYIAITGTNGKTTTTKLLGEILTRWGKKVFVGGNIGNPLVSYLNGEKKEEYLVVEVSSFQLQWMSFFHPSVAVLLNTSRDHLDYHESFEEYRSVKERIFVNQLGGDRAILNADESPSPGLLEGIKAEIIRFSSSSSLERGIFLDGGALHYLDSRGEREIYPVSNIRLKGVHNLENIMAAIVAARWCGCPPETIIDTLEKFDGMPHRVECVGEKNGVAFYNDSKGTNVGAVERALESFPGSVILLMGGRDKGGDFERLREPIGQKVRQLVLFGEAGDRIHRLLGNIVETAVVEGLGDAMVLAFSVSKPGDTVLLSPGCSSFDEFENYEARGDFFKESVNRMVVR